MVEMGEDPRCPKHGSILEWCDGSWFCHECWDEYEAEEESIRREYEKVTDYRWLRQLNLFPVEE